ncbi:MAG: SDR family NAD(P)-dependent oxidoreductase [Thermoanaerobaculia bacterium]
MAPKTALVTGAGSGIGRAVARELGRQGHRLLLLGRNAERLAALTGELEAEGLGNRSLALDLAESASFEELAQLASEVDVLVHNASYFPPYQRVEKLDPAELARMSAVGLEAALALSRLVLPGMKRRGFGRIVLVGSVAATLGGQGQAAYATIKASLGALARVLATEASGHGVTANLVELGLIETERMEAVVKPELRAALLARIPAGRFGQVEEVAALVAFLASEKAAYLTGATLPLTGGLGLGFGGA